MNRLRGGVVGGLVGGAAFMGGARLWQRATRGGNSDDLPYMPDELLLTLHDATGPARPDDDRVRALVRRAEETAGGHRLEVIDKAQAGHDQAHLTLRLRVRRKSGAARRHHVKEATDGINGRLHELQHHGVAVSSAMPNWIIGSGGAHILGGPGTVPDPAPGGDWRMTVPVGGAWPSAGRSHDDTPPDPRVVVAVLDSSPGLQRLRDAAARPLYHDNALLHRLADGVITDWNRFTPPDDVPAGGHPRSEADHGIFVAGIVNSIAPHADIHLLHVLDDQGLGRTDLLLDALDYCLALAHGGQRVVVNLSLYLMIPPRPELWQHWFGPLSHQITRQPTHRASLIDALDEGVERRVDLLLDAGAVIVAAAGNDALWRRRAQQGAARGDAADGQPHPRPRVPADYAGVLCVVATDRAGKIAAYSNRADVPPLGHCVATYGGQGIRDGANAVVPPGANPRDGMVSLYTGHDVATTDGPKFNDTGWVYWSGTSFATPVISGIAANVLAHNEMERRDAPATPRLTPREVARRILAMAAPPAETDPNLGCPYVPVAQHMQ